LDVDEAYAAFVTRNARESFVGAHGGTFAEAEAELRSMLEDFLLLRAWRREEDRWILSHDGFVLGLSGDGAVIGYSTAHRERSWSQVKAGVRSRVSTPRNGRNHKNHKVSRELEGAVVDEASLRAIDPASMTTNSYALKNFRRAQRDGVGQLTRDSTFQDVLAADLRASQAVLIEVAGRPTWVVYGPDIRWTIRADGKALLGTAYYAYEYMRTPPSQRTIE
jgi:hypothetical protein